MAAQDCPLVEPKLLAFYSNLVKLNFNCHLGSGKQHFKLLLWITLEISCIELSHRSPLYQLRCVSLRIHFWYWVFNQLRWLYISQRVLFYKLREEIFFVQGALLLGSRTLVSYNTEGTPALLSNLPCIIVTFSSQQSYCQKWIYLPIASYDLNRHYDPIH